MEVKKKKKKTKNEQCEKYARLKFFADGDMKARSSSNSNSNGSVSAGGESMIWDGYQPTLSASNK